MLAVDPIRIANKHVGTPASSAERPIRHSEVIAREVAFGQTELWEQHLVRVRERDLVPGNQKGFSFAGSHCHLRVTVLTSHQSYELGDLPRRGLSVGTAKPNLR